MWLDAAPTRGRRVKRVRLREVVVEHEVPFHDVDALGVVWHGHYFKYFELARTRLLRNCDLDAGPLIGGRYRFLVVDARCRHVGALRYGDRMRVHAWFAELQRRVGIAYEIWNETQAFRAARGHTALATLDGDGRLLFEVPDEIVRRIRG
jgi:acyl-CoA thioester hydrolase